MTNLDRAWEAAVNASIQGMVFAHLGAPAAEHAAEHMNEAEAAADAVVEAVKAQQGTPSMLQAIDEAVRVLAILTGDEAAQEQAAVMLEEDGRKECRAAIEIFLVLRALLVCMDDLNS